MAVAPEVIAAAPEAEGAAWRAASAASGQLRRVPAAAAGGARTAAKGVSSPSAAAQTITRLIWAVAVGLIVLQIAAEATGQQWSFHLPGLSSPQPKVPYLPLYAGQQVSGALPGVLPPTSQPAVPAPLSGRSAGNQGVV